MNMNQPEFRTITPQKQVKSRPFLSRNERYLIKEVRGIVVHYTANPNATAEQNARYLDNPKKPYSSWHYVCDENETILCIPETEVAYHVGGRSYKPAGKALFTNFYGRRQNPNFSTLGVEICNNGDWEKASERAAHVVAWLRVKYGLGIKDIYRHYDITGKICPKPFVDSHFLWRGFQRDVLVYSAKYQ